MKIIHMICSAAVAGAAAGAVTPVHAQSLADRAAAGTVTFSFETRPGVCGDGAGLIARRDSSGTNIMHMDRHSSITTRGTRDNLENCVHGPAVVRVARSGSVVNAVDVRVGGGAYGNARDLGTVDAAEAEAWLLDVARTSSADVGQDALVAASLGAAPEAMTTGLLALSHARNITKELRKGALFWLGQSDEQRAASRLREIIDDRDEAVDVRETAIFAYSRHDSPAVVEKLIAFARSSDQQKLRTSAVFWLGQMAGDKATAGLRSILDDDSEEIEVRQSAIFAITQQKNDESLQTLMRIASTSKEPELRRNAMFWLGQRGDDPRVLKFFEDILLGH